MKFTKKQIIDLVPVRDGRAVSEITEADLKKSGMAFASFGLSVGDKIEFPEKGGAVFLEQPVRPGSNAKSIMMSVMRNDKPSVLALGSLIATGINFKAPCDATTFLRDPQTFPSNAERVEYLYGKRLRVTGEVELDAQKFTEAGVRIPGETEKRMFRTFEIENIE